MNLQSRAGSAASWSLIALLFLGTMLLLQADATIKVGFIYVGPISDFGWTHNQNEGRLELERNLPWVKTSYVESVSEGDIESVIDQMAGEGITVIFCTSSSFTDGTITAAAQHPDIIFFNASGYKHAPNVANYDADAYQCSYLTGLAAGALSKTGKIGYVCSYPSPEAVRGIDAFTLGLRTVNSGAVVKLRWLNSSYDPVAAKEAAEALLIQGCDALITDQDSPTIANVAEAHHVPVDSESFSAVGFAPNSLITSDVFDWGPAYTMLLRKVRDGTLNSKNLLHVDEWWRLGDQAVKMFYKPGVLLNPRYKDALSAAQADDGTGHMISVYDLIQKRFGQMSVEPPQFEPFTGPLSDAQQKPLLAPGQIVTKAQLFSMTWRMPGISGDWPIQ